MEIEIDQERFVATLALGLTVADKRNTMPILANVLLRASSEGQLVCATTDMIIGLTAHVPVQVHRTGGVTLGVRHLHGVVRTLPSGVLKLKSLDNHWAEILCGRSEFKLMGRAHDDFPELPDPKGLKFTDVDGAELIDLIHRTQFAVSPDEARINLNGVLLECDGENATMVATDGHRLTKYTRAFAGPKLESGVIIPRKGMLEVRRLLERVTGDTSMAVGEGHLFVRADELLLSVKLTNVTFPPYREVIPGAHDRRAYVDREEFQTALRRAEVVAPEKTATVRLRLEAGVMELTADNPDLGVARQEIAVEYDSSELVAGFNARYLMDVLEVIETDEVQLDFQGELDPCVLRPRDGADYLGVVMPMRI